MKALLRWFTVLSICGLIGAGLLHYKLIEIQESESASADMPEHTETVEAKTLQMIEYTPSMQVIGETVAAHQMTVLNELPGQIVALNFAAGARVDKDQILLQLDISEEQARLKSARAQLKLARSTYKRLSRLDKSHHTSQAQLDQAKASLRIAEADIELLQIAIRKKTIRAPFAAQAGLHELEVGQYLQQGTQITQLIGLENFVWVDFHVPQFYAHLAVGSAVKVSHAEAEQSAKITALNPSLSANARSVHYRARLPVTDNEVMPNTVVSVTVPTGQAQQYLAVPRNAIRRNANHDYIYVLSAEADQQSYRAHQQMIKVLDEYQDLSLIESSAKAGELIASAGSFKLFEGVRVVVAERAGAE